MAKTIIIEHEGNDYTLEFTRRTVAEMEQSGFKISDITEKPVSVLPELFAGAFKAHHRLLKREIVDAIYDGIADKQDFIVKLAEMYTEPIETLMGEGKNRSWKASW